MTRQASLTARARPVYCCLDSNSSIVFRAASNLTLLFLLTSMLVMSISMR